MTTQPFDHNAPLPDLHIPHPRSWEPAARHYRDLTPEEREDVVNAPRFEADK